MKSSIKALACITTIIAALCGTAEATPRAIEVSGANHLFAAEDLEGLHLGAYYRYSSFGTTSYSDISHDNIALTLGYDVLDWVTVYAIAGSTDVKPGNNTFGDRGTAFLYGIGAWANILDHDIISGLSCETRLRLTATAQFTAASPEINDVEYDYTETYGALTLGILNELSGNKSMWPDAIGVFVGPVYNNYDSDVVESTGDELGIAFGLDVYVSSRVGLSASYETYNGENEAMNFSLSYSF